MWMRLRISILDTFEPRLLLCLIGADHSKIRNFVAALNGKALGWAAALCRLGLSSAHRLPFRSVRFDGESCPQV